MAELNQLSPKLQAFDTTVVPSIPSMTTAKGDIANYVKEAKTRYQSALDGMIAGIKEDMGDCLKSCMDLLIEASDRLIRSMETDDMGEILTKCNEVIKIIEEIKAKREEGKGWEESGFKKEWVILDGVRQLLNKWFANDQYKIERANAEIDNLNKKGEAQLQAISAAANSVSLGIVGNMVHGGTLGAWGNFSSSYTFNAEAWEAQNPIAYPLTIVDTVGCFVVGQVEGVVNLVEGLVDFVATPVAWVTSACGWDGVENFIERDWSKEGADAVIGVLGLENDAKARGAGKFIGEVAGAIAVSCVASPAAGMALLAMSTGGESIERNLNNGDSLGMASLKGFGTAAITYVGGQAVMKFTGPLLGKLAKVPVVDKVVSAVKPVWNKVANSTIGKAAVGVGKFVTLPARKTADVLITKNPLYTRVAAPAVTKVGSVLNNTGLGQRLAGTKVGQFLGFTPKSAGVAPKPNINAEQIVNDRTIEPTRNTQEQMDFATGVNKPAASTQGAPSQGNSAFEQMDDGAFKAYQNRNGIETMDDYAERVVRNNTVDPGRSTQSIIDDATGINKPAASTRGAPSQGNSAFEQMDDAAFNAYQSRNGIQSTDDFAEQVIRNNTVDPGRSTQSIIDDVTGVNKPAASTQGAPTQGNSAFQNASASQLGAPTQGNSAFQNASASQLGAPTQGNSVFEQMDDAAFNAYQSRNGIQSADDFAEQVIRNNTVQPQQGTQSIIDDLTGVNRSPASAHGAPTQGNSVFEQMDDATASTFEQTNWQMYDPARPGAVGTEKGYIQNGEFVQGSTFAPDKQITADTSMFSTSSNKQFKGYQNRNGINKNQLPPV